MPKDPTLLPEDMRKAEEDVQRASGARGNARGVFHVPSDDEKSDKAQESLTLDT